LDVTVLTGKNIQVMLIFMMECVRVRDPYNGLSCVASIVWWPHDIPGKFYIVAVGGSWYSEQCNSKISSVSQLCKKAIWAMQEEYFIIQYNYYKYNIRNKLKYLVSVRQDYL